MLAQCLRAGQPKFHSTMESSQIGILLSLHSLFILMMLLADLFLFTGMLVADYLSDGHTSTILYNQQALFSFFPTFIKQYATVLRRILHGIIEVFSYDDNNDDGTVGQILDILQQESTNLCPYFFFTALSHLDLPITWKSPHKATVPSVLLGHQDHKCWWGWGLGQEGVPGSATAIAGFLSYWGVVPPLRPSPMLQNVPFFARKAFLFQIDPPSEHPPQCSKNLC